MSKKSSDLLTRGGKKRLRTVTLQVSAKDWRAAQRLARMRTLGSLEEMLSALVADVATAYERPGSWEAGRVWDWLDSRYELPQFLRITKEDRRA
jgi:hypothetical protein